MKTFNVLAGGSLALKQTFILKRFWIVLLVFLTMLCVLCQCRNTSEPIVPLKYGIKRVILIVLENANQESALAQPFLSSLTKRGAFLSNYNAVTHPSQPNYLAMISGDGFGVGDENATIDAKHLGNLLEARGKTWKSYAEGYPGDCFLHTYHNKYYRKHVPFLSFKNIQNSKDQCAHVVPGSEFLTDLAKGTLPDFSFYTPDMDNDGHDTGVEYADRWLAQFWNDSFSKIDPSTLIIVTFDEGIDPNKVYTVFYGGSVRPGVVSHVPYTHYSLLRTLEDIYSLPTLGKNDETAPIINDIWVTEN